MNRIGVSAVLLFCILLFSLSSCSGEKTEIAAGDKSGDLTTDYILYTDESYVVPRLFKLNVKTLSISSVCVDPVCTHDSAQCPMYNVYDINQIGDMLYFNSYLENRGIIGYDLKTGNTKNVLEYDRKNPDDNPFCIAVAGKYIFYQCQRLKVNEDGSAQRSHFDVYRLDTETGEKIFLGDTKDLLFPSDPLRINEFSDSEIIWDSMMGMKIVTDYDFNVLSEGMVSSDDIFERGAYSYTGEKSDPSDPKCNYSNLYLIDSETGEKKLIGEELVSYFITDECIVYLQHDKDKRRLMFSKEDDEKLIRDYYDRTNSEVYVMGLDGSDPHLICTIEDPYLENTAITFIENTKGMNNFKDGVCIVRIAYYYKELMIDSETREEYSMVFSVDAGGIAAVNTVTGEYRVLYPDARPYSSDIDVTPFLKTE